MNRRPIRVRPATAGGAAPAWLLAAVAVLAAPAAGPGAPGPAGAGQLVAGSDAAPAGFPESPGNADYTIEVRLDPSSRVLEGRQTLTWQNLRSRPAGELRFHLYWNAFRNDRSTWLLEDRLRGRSGLRDVRREDWGYLDVTATRLRLEGGEEVDLTPRQHFVAPDDGNPDDRTVLAVPLPEPVPPGGTVRIEMRWTARVPRTFARTGVRGEFFFVAHWFPKLGVYGDDGWNCHQFHAVTEFFSDYGDYDVRITVPARFVVGATGREASREPNGDGTITLRFRQRDVHGFAWTASPDFEEHTARFDEPGLPPVDLRLLLQPEHRGQAERHFEATRAALEHFGHWYGPYPYGHLTLVDPAYGSGAGGMEYPTLFTCGTNLWVPFGGDRPESVTVHEAGHQFWYGIVGNDEFEHAWLDEGLNTFSTLRTLDEAFGPRRLVRRYLSPPAGGRGRPGFFPLIFRDIEISRFGDRVNRYRRSAGAVLPASPTFRYLPQAAHDITYSKTALWLLTLERHLGWETLRRGMSAYFREHAFGHPTPDDFFAALEDAAGTDLDWFFDQVYRNDVTFDYAVDSVASVPATTEGWIESEPGDASRLQFTAPGDDSGGDVLQRTEVIVRRRGGGRFPVDVLLVFEDGHRIRERWDGRARWKRFVVEHAAKLEHAAVDPERVLWLDLDVTNNTRLREPRSTLPAVEWAAKWMLWLQDRLMAFEFFL